MIGQIYHVIFYQPIFNALVWFYNIIPGHDVGIAIILVTIILKLILYPFSAQSIHAQKRMQELQPKLDGLKTKFKDDKQGLAKATMELYKTEKISPFSSCLPLLIQFPFLIAVYSVFRNGLAGGEKMNALYSFVHNPGNLNPISFGLLDMSKSNIILAVLAGVAQWWVSKMLIVKKQPAVPGAKDESMTAIMNKQMTIFMPLMTVFIGISLPSGLALYWLVTTILTGVQQLYTFKNIKIQEHKNTRT
jgi:YidC/Oxa1 family membrane protein insertase